MMNIPERGVNMLEKMKKINKNSPLPLYYQLKESLLSLIKSEEIKSGEKIPSERKLCDYHGISRMTVHKAVEQLVREGYLYREHGKGTFIADRVSENQISPFNSFTEEIERKGLSSSTILKKMTTLKGNAEICQRLKIKTGSDIYQLKRLRLIEGSPFLWEIVYLPYEKCPELNKEKIKDSSLYNLLENNYELDLGQAEATVEPVIIPDEVAGKLKLEERNELGLLFHQLTYLQNGQPIEWTKAYYRSDSYKFKLKFGESF